MFKEKSFRKKMLFGLNGKVAYQYNVLDFAKLMEQNGVGELIVQSIDRDGMMNGFEKNLKKKIRTKYRCLWFHLEESVTILI